MRRTLQGILAPVVLAVVSSMGCGTTYLPREPNRIHVVLNAGGQEVFEKDGKTYDVRGFSAGLLEAVQGNPAAEEHARTYVRRQRIANGLTIVAATALVIGYVSLAFLVGPYDSTTEGSGPDPHARKVLMITMSSALALGLASMTGSAIASQPLEGHLYDAVNIYNDGAARAAR